jgi:hypothetical protein
MHSRPRLARRKTGNTNMDNLVMTEGQRANAWRKAQGLSVAKLSALTGYSVRSIAVYEAGKQGNGEPVAPEAMLRYRLACAAVHHGHHKHFDWM